jgi:hypothetical protein
MMSFVDYLSIVLMFMGSLVFWYSVAAIGLELWNRWSACPRQVLDAGTAKA